MQPAPAVTPNVMPAVTLPNVIIAEKATANVKTCTIALNATTFHVMSAIKTMPCLGVARAAIPFVCQECRNRPDTCQDDSCGVCNFVTAIMVVVA